MYEWSTHAKRITSRISCIPFTHWARELELRDAFQWIDEVMITTRELEKHLTNKILQCVPKNETLVILIIRLSLSTAFGVR